MIRANETWVDLGEIVEGTSPTIRARCLNEDDGLPTAASISSIAMKIYDISAGQDAATIVGTETALTVGSVWYDTLQTSDTWEDTTAGFNFEYVIAAASLVGSASGLKKYQIEIRATPTSGNAFWVVRARVTVTNAQGF
jgi:hypothetical protein